MIHHPPFNRLTPKEAELLACLAEECAEVVQAVEKIKRHGMRSTHPETGVFNDSHLHKELGDVCGIMSLMVQIGMLTRAKIEQATDAKMVNVLPYLHHWSNAK